MDSIIKFRHNTAEYSSILNYTLSTDDFLGMIRCIVLVDDETHESYEAIDEQPIPCCGKCNDKMHWKYMQNIETMKANIMTLIQM